MESNTPKVKVESVSIACNMNTVYNAFDLNKKECIIAYACCNLVVILD
jgi:hypothetical protein